MTSPTITPDHPNARAVAGIVEAWAKRVAMDTPGAVPDSVAVNADFTALHRTGKDTEFVDTPPEVAQAVRALLGDEGSCLDVIRYSHEGAKVDRIPVLRT